jgi:hypothetical protein
LAGKTGPADNAYHAAEVPWAMRSIWASLFVAMSVLAGCVEGTPDPVGPAVVAPQAPAPAANALEVANASLARGLSMGFAERVVTAAVSHSNDLYEPTLEVSDTGVVYITGHTVLVDTTGAPVFMSQDDGQTWTQLPFLGSNRMPGTLPGATPPPSDEIFLVAGDGGWLYGVDITLATFPVNGWSGDGAELAYHNPNAYDEHQAVMQADSCVAAPAKDRPWAAYANGTLLMVSNPASGPAQVGVLPVPPGPLGLVPAPVGVGAASGGGWWNLCAGPNQLPAENNIPGVPDIRGDGLFAVPQRAQGNLYVLLGNKADVMDVEARLLFPLASGGEITSLYGNAAFDGRGDLFVGITNNTRPDADGNRTGRLRFAASTDGGRTFVDATYETGLGAPVRHFYMDGNKAGPGALVVWAVDGSGRDAQGRVSGWDWYVGHLQVDADGAPRLVDAFLAIDEGPRPSAHVTGAGVGPDGRAYLATYKPVEPLGTPLSVWVQTEGPRLPVDPR